MHTSKKGVHGNNGIMNVCLSFEERPSSFQTLDVIDSFFARLASETALKRCWGRLSSALILVQLWKHGFENNRDMFDLSCFIQLPHNVGALKSAAWMGKGLINIHELFIYNFDIQILRLVAGVPYHFCRDKSRKRDTEREIIPFAITRELMLLPHWKSLNVGQQWEMEWW